MTYDEFKKNGKKTGALKRKLKIKGNQKLATGDLISKANEIKKMNPRKRTAFMGMI